MNEAHKNSEFPLVAGGQGRSARSVAADGDTVSVTLTLLVLLSVALLAVAW